MIYKNSDVIKSNSDSDDNINNYDNNKYLI